MWPLILDNDFKLYNKYEIIGYGKLYDGVYSITLQNNIVYNSINVVDRLNIVWWMNFLFIVAPELNHISIFRFKRLVSEGVTQNRIFYFVNFSEKLVFALSYLSNMISK